MHLLPILTLLASPLPSLATAARITFTLPTAPNIPAYNPSALPPSTRATLLGQATTVSAPITRRNTFEFDNVSQGSWLFTVQCRDYSYGPLRVDVLSLAAEPEGGAAGKEKVEAFQTFWGNEWGNKGEWRGGGTVGGEGEPPVVVEVRPERAKQYYTVRGGFSPLQFLKSPMILMALFSLVMIVGVPYLTESMDDETRAEFEAIQKKSPVAQAASGASGLQNFDLASWMAGKSAGVGTASGSGRDNDGGGTTGKR